VEPEATWVGLLASSLPGTRLAPLARPGASIGDIGRLQLLLLPEQAALVTVLAGLNDVARAGVDAGPPTAISSTSSGVSGCTAGWPGARTCLPRPGGSTPRTSTATCCQAARFPSLSSPPSGSAAWSTGSSSTTSAPAAGSSRPRWCGSSHRCERRSTAPSATAACHEPGPARRAPAPRAPTSSGVDRGPGNGRMPAEGEYRVALIEVEKTNYPVLWMCSMLKVARSSFYAWRSRAETPTGLRRRRLGERVASCSKPPAAPTAAGGSPRR